MKIRLPLISQKGRPNCGPASLKMIFSYFGNKISIQDLEKELGYKEGKGISTIRLAITAKKLGYEVLLLTNSIMPRKENFELDFYKKYSDEDFNGLKLLADEAKKLKVTMVEKSISLGKLLSFINKKTIPVVLLDWNIIRNQEKEGFMGHYVPLVGFDADSVYVNNSGGIKPTRFKKISKSTFDKARKARGTDEDILIISRKTRQS
ncbi:MAG: C39 family peptidase [Candidatus Pacearchaeota archaeon]|jgi:hypothetical protein